MLFSLPANCTVEHAAELKKALWATLQPGAQVKLDANNVQRADITVFQLLYCLERELTAAGGRLSLHAIQPVLVSEAKAAGLDAWFQELASTQEN